MKKFNLNYPFNRDIIRIWKNWYFFYILFTVLCFSYFLLFKFNVDINFFNDYINFFKPYLFFIVLGIIFLNLHNIKFVNLLFNFMNIYFNYFILKFLFLNILYLNFLLSLLFFFNVLLFFLLFFFKKQVFILYILAYPVLPLILSFFIQNRWLNYIICLVWGDFFKTKECDLILLFYF